MSRGRNLVYAIDHPEIQPRVTDARPQVLPCSSMQRSFLLDETVYVVDLKTRPRPNMESMTAVTRVRSFILDGTEEEAWRVLGSSMFEDRRDGGLYTQTDMQPESALGRQQVSWMRIPHNLGASALLAAPRSMPREMIAFEPSPDLISHIDNVAHQAGHLIAVAL